MSNPDSYRAVQQLVKPLAAEGRQHLQDRVRPSLHCVCVCCLVPVPAWTGRAPTSLVSLPLMTGLSPILVTLPSRLVSLPLLSRSLSRPVSLPLSSLSLSRLVLVEVVAKAVMTSTFEWCVSLPFSRPSSVSLPFSHPSFSPRSILLYLHTMPLSCLAHRSAPAPFPHKTPTPLPHTQFLPARMYDLQAQRQDATRFSGQRAYVPRTRGTDRCARPGRRAWPSRIRGRVGPKLDPRPAQCGRMPASSGCW